MDEIEDFDDEWGLASGVLVLATAIVVATTILGISILWGAASLASQAVQAVRHKP